MSLLSFKKEESESVSSGEDQKVRALIEVEGNCVVSIGRLEDSTEGFEEEFLAEWKNINTHSFRIDMSETDYALIKQYEDSVSGFPLDEALNATLDLNEAERNRRRLVSSSVAHFVPGGFAGFVQGVAHTPLRIDENVARELMEVIVDKARSVDEGRLTTYFDLDKMGNVLNVEGGHGKSRYAQRDIIAGEGLFDAETRGVIFAIDLPETQFRNLVERKGDIVGKKLCGAEELIKQAQKESTDKLYTKIESRLGRTLEVEGVCRLELKKECGIKTRRGFEGRGIDD